MMFLQGNAIREKTLYSTHAHLFTMIFPSTAGFFMEVQSQVKLIRRVVSLIASQLQKTSVGFISGDLNPEMGGSMMLRPYLQKLITAPMSGILTLKPM